MRSLPFSEVRARISGASSGRRVASVMPAWYAVVVWPLGNEPPRQIPVVSYPASSATSFAENW
jgi:hypothetical protein